MSSVNANLTAYIESLNRERIELSKLMNSDDISDYTRTCSIVKHNTILGVIKELSLINEINYFMHPQLTPYQELDYGNK